MSIVFSLNTYLLNCRLGAVWSSFFGYVAFPLLLTIREHLGSSSVFFGKVRVAYLFALFFVLWFVLLIFVLYLVSNVSCISGLSILDCPFGFL